MSRSTKPDKARQLNAAFAMLGKVPLPEAMQRLSRKFDLSERQASGVCEKQLADDRCDRDASVGRVSEYSEKAWLSRAERAAGFKFTLTICLIACTTRSSPRPTVFLCPFGSAPSVAA